MLLGAFLWDTSILRNFEISKIYWNVSLLLDQAQEQEVRFIYLAYLLIRTTLRKENREQRSFKKHFEFRNFNEILCGMTRLRNTNLSVFMQCQYTRTILKNKKWGRVGLRNIQNFKMSMRYFTVAWPDSETWIWMFLCNASTQELFQERKI